MHVGGLSNREIARQLQIDRESVRRYIRVETEKRRVEFEADCDLRTFKGGTSRSSVVHLHALMPSLRS